MPIRSLSTLRHPALPKKHHILHSSERIFKDRVHLPYQYPVVRDMLSSRHFCTRVVVSMNNARYVLWECIVVYCMVLSFVYHELIVVEERENGGEELLGNNQTLRGERSSVISDFSLNKCFYSKRRKDSCCFVFSWFLPVIQL